MLHVTLRSIMDLHPKGRRDVPELSAAEAWVERCINLAYSPADTSDEVLASMVRTIRGHAWKDGDTSHGSRETRDILREILDKYPRKGARGRPRNPGELKEVFVDAALHIGKRGRLELHVDFLLNDHDAMSLLLRTFLDDPALDIGSHLRKCRLESCGRLFISRSTIGGGPRPHYCSSEHRIIADNLDAANRMARRRTKLKRAAAQHK